MAIAHGRAPHVLEPISGQASRLGVDGFVGPLITRLQSHLADRRLRDHLAGLDDALLRDIGIETDEIWRVRQRHRFTPRRWQNGTR